MEHEKLMGYIMEAEERTQAIVHAEERKQDNLFQALEAESRQLLETYLVRARRRIEAAEQAERQAADEEIERLKRQLAVDLATAEERFQLEQETHLRSILAQILGVDT